MVERRDSQPGKARYDPPRPLPLPRSSWTSTRLDLDGTIVDSQPGISARCLAALRALGHAPRTPLDLSAIIGPPIDDITRSLLEPCGDDRVVEAVSAYREDYGGSGPFDSAPYPGIAEALAEMRRAGAQLLPATSKRRTFAETILDHLDLAGLFEGIYGSEPGGALDHKPELIFHVIERHELRQSRRVMVGDRRHDVAGAHANGMPALGVWGYGSRNDLEGAGADDLVAEPNGLSKAALAMVGTDRPLR